MGAGIVGAAVAYEAARAGAQVALIDKGLPGSGVTADSFAWIGEPRPGEVPDASSALRRHTLRAWRRWDEDVPGVRVRWHGALLLGAEQASGDGERLVEAGRVEPHLVGPPARAVHLERHGAVDPVAVTQAVARAAQGHGARLMTGTVVTGLVLGEGRVVGVESSAGRVGADTVVVAAGVDAPVRGRALGFDLPVAPSPALLMRFAAPPGLVRTLIVGPDLEIREAAEGELLVPAAYHGESDHDALRQAGEQMRRRLVATFGSDDIRLLGVRVGARPMPADGLPVIGPVPGVLGAYLAVMHSGITLAPSVARLITSELVDGAEADELADLRPARFANAERPDASQGPLHRAQPE